MELEKIRIKVKKMGKFLRPVANGEKKKGKLTRMVVRINVLLLRSATIV
jgi:hypothetical protein